MVEIIVPPAPAPTNVPAFLAKLWKMVENPDTDDYICWTEDGTSFRIRDQSQFASALLPYYYKHSNMASFVRQLNMYGFHKVIALHSGNLKSEKEEIEFAHMYFCRGQEFLLDQIKRKSSSSSKSQAAANTNQQSFITCGVKPEPVFITKIDNSDKEELVNEFLTEMGNMKERQEDLDNKMESMRSENEALWGEVLGLRQKHHQQQKIVNKLIQFLVALVQPRISKGIKRKFRHPSFPSPKLAIEEDTPSPKEAKVQEIAEEIEECHLYDILGSESHHNYSRPDNKDAEDDSVLSDPKSKYTMVDPASVTPSLKQIKIEKMTNQDLSPSKLVSNPSVEDMDSDHMTQELDSLKDILAGSGQITLDTSFMTGLMSGDSTEFLNGMKLFADSMLTSPEEQSSSSPPHSQYQQDLKFLTYSASEDPDMTMGSSILAMAAESSGINLERDLEEELLSTPPRPDFDVDLDF